jgi:hypothetical protein
MTTSTAKPVTVTAHGDFTPRPRGARLRQTATAAAMLGVLMFAAGCAPMLPRDANGSPPTARLVPNAIPPAPITPEESARMSALNQQILREQNAAIANEQQAQAYARAAQYAYPPVSTSLYYGGWGGGHWGGGVGFGVPLGGWGGYPGYW